MIEINIINESDGKVLEIIETRHEPQDYIMHRGRLLVRKSGSDYVEKSYLEMF